MKYYVYLINIKHENICKIGITKESKTPEGRIKELQTGCPFELNILGSYLSEYGRKIESILHRQYVTRKIDENYNTLKGEWFELSDEEINEFEETCKSIEKTLVFLKNTSTFDNPLDKI